MIPFVLLIGGIDSSGGAGLVQDTRGVQAYGLHAAVATTLVSSQSHTKTTEVMPVATSLFAEQLDAAFSLASPRAIKIGALANAEQVAVVVDKLKVHPTIPVVWDPVQTTSSDVPLGILTPDTAAALLPHVTVLTPNINELGTITGLPVNTNKSQLIAAHNLLAYGCQYVLVKGGHQQNRTVTDTLYYAESTWHFTHQQKASFSLRGSGCLLATAIASGLATGYDPEDAVCQAEAVIAYAFEHAVKIDDAIGAATSVAVPHSHSYYPRVYRDFTDVSDLPAFPPLDYSSPGLYPVVDSVEWLARLLPLGIRIIQLRLKRTEHSVQNISSAIKQAVALAKNYATQLFINDHWEQAIEHGAYGVHLGQSDLNHANLHRIASAGLRLGVSTHGYAELCRGLTLRPSYIALGHVYPTQTKNMPSSPQGPVRLAKYTALCGNTPTVAIGGIKLHNLDEVLGAKVSSVAVVTAITNSHAPTDVVRQFQQRIQQGQQTDAAVASLPCQSPILPVTASEPC